MIVVTSASCGRSTSKLTPAERDARLGQIAADYARSGDLTQAQDELAKLDFANPGQLLLVAAEQSLQDNRPSQDTQELAVLADALGARSRLLEAYLPPDATPIPGPSSTGVPPEQPTEPAAAPPAITLPTPADTPTLAPTATITPTLAPSPTVAKAHVVADSTVNLRGGPGTVYPVVGQLRAGQASDIVGRNASGDWWQVTWDGQGQAWVAGTIVNVLGPIDTVAVAPSIPTPRPSPTTEPTVPPTATTPPRPSVDYIVKSLRLRPVGQDAQKCGGGGDNGIWVYVEDPGGNRLDGVRIKEIFTGIVQVSGSDQKGPGAAHWPIYRGGGGQMVIVDDAGNVRSDVTRGMSDDWPDFDLMKAAGYCDCHPFNDAECQAALQNHTYAFAAGHYTYEVVFQRTY